MNVNFPRYFSFLVPFIVAINKIDKPNANPVSKKYFVCNPLIANFTKWSNTL